MGKHRHRSRGAAEAHIRGLIKIGAPGTDALHAYFCVRCGGWHVGNGRDER